MIRKPILVLSLIAIIVALATVGVRLLVKDMPSGNDAQHSSVQPGGNTPGWDDIWQRFTEWRDAPDNTQATQPDKQADQSDATAATQAQDEDFDPYHRCEAMQDTNAWRMCTDKVDAQMEALEDACDKYEDEQWIECIEAAERLQPYAPPER